MFKELHNNIKLVDALAQMPKYAKPLKDLLTNKEKLEELANTPLNAEFSEILLNKIPEKLRDPGKFIIPCFFKDLEVCNALADSKPSINRMPYSLYLKLGMGELKPTTMSLQLADRSMTYPVGISEDILVRVEKLIFPADFVVVDIEVDTRAPLILGRPFFRTAKALVDVYEEKFTLRVGDEKLVFHVEKSSKFPSDHDDGSVHRVDVIEFTRNEYFHVVLSCQKSINPFSSKDQVSTIPTSPSVSINESSLTSLTLFEGSDFYLEEFAGELASVDSFPLGNDHGDFDPEADLREIDALINQDPSENSSNTTNENITKLMKDGNSKIKTSIEEPPTLELKDLPPHLEYAYLSGTSQLHIIIAKDLKDEEKDHDKCKIHISVNTKNDPKCPKTD
ncbi:reverse transcriptase domain-containing protein [Tanacetum coccineum]